MCMLKGQNREAHVNYLFQYAGTYRTSLITGTMRAARIYAGI